MWFGAVELAHAVGNVLGHNIADPNGQRVFRKGRVLSADDVALLARLGRTDVYVAKLEANDVDENEASRRVGDMLAGRV